MKKLLLLFIILMVTACVTAFVDKTAYVLDPPNQNLRGHAADGSDDKALTTCDPAPKPGHPGEFTYPCVAHYISDYAALLKKINDLEQQLVACQQGHL